MKEKSHCAFAMYGCLDKVIGLLYLCPSLSPCTPCESCTVKNWGFFGQQSVVTLVSHTFGKTYS